MTATEVREKQILFSAPMVRSILSGSKTQTRRIAKFVPREAGLNLSASSLQLGHYFTGKPDSGFVLRSMGGSCWNDRTYPLHCPYGRVGDRLWVREAWKPGSDLTAFYRADKHMDVAGWPWRPSIHMPRWASRITLEITDIRVQRLRDISEEDARAEGVDPWFPSIQLYAGCIEDYAKRGGSYRNGFHELWESINAKRAPWASNPFVWALSFKRLP